MSGVFHGYRDASEEAPLSRIVVAGAIRAPQRRKANWRRLWSLWGPLLPILFAAGLIIGTAAAVVQRVLLP